MFESAPKKRKLTSRTQEMKLVNGDIMVTNTFTFSDGATFTLSVGVRSDMNNKGTAVNFYEIPTSGYETPTVPTGGKRRNNKRKSAKKGGRNRRMFSKRKQYRRI